MPYATNTYDGARIFYEVVGKGPPLVLRHGLLGSGEDWRAVGFVDGLSGRFQLILVDGRGRGKSDRTPQPKAYQPPMQVADVVSVLDDLGIDRSHFLGYSEGGVVGCWMGVHAPERLRSLAIGAANCINDVPEQHHIWRDHLKRGMLSFVDMIERENGPVSAELRQRYLANDGPSAAACMDGLWSVLLTDDDARSITAPSFLYVGDLDAPTSESMRHLSTLMPDVELHVLQDLNHFQVAVRSDLTLPLISAFLERAEAEWS